MRMFFLAMGVLGAVACKSTEKTSGGSAPIVDPISVASLPSGVPKERIVAINAAIQGTDASLPAISSDDCGKATAAVVTIVTNIKIVRDQNAELRKTVASLNDPAVNDWVKRSVDPIVNGRAFEAGKQLASKGPTSKCMSDPRFAEALKSSGGAVTEDAPH